MIDLKIKYNNLTLISEPYSIKSGYTTRKVVDCKCDCGKILKKVVLSKLKDNSTKSCKNCSFQNREFNKERIVTQVEQLYNHNIIIRCKDSKKNISNNLSLEQFKTLIYQNCYYCGDEPKPSLRFKNRKYLNSEIILINGIDRIDSDLGYSIENCVSCCTTCNKMKMDLKQNEFILKIEKIMNNLKLRNH